MEPNRSSNVTKAIMSPLRVAFILRSVIRPPIAALMPSKESPLSGYSSAREDRKPALTSSWDSSSRNSSSGWPVMYTPVTSFSMSSSALGGSSFRSGSGGGGTSTSISPNRDS